MNRVLLLTLFLSTGLVAQAPDSLSDSLRNGPRPGSVFTKPILPVSDQWFSQDKFLHFYFSATIAGLSYHIYADQLKRDNNQGKVISVSLTALVGLGKEIYDKKKKNHFSWKDLFWDGAGLAAGYLLFIQL
jgi:uncharacterized protein YfiM (DUF2279 family)